MKRMLMHARRMRRNSSRARSFVIQEMKDLVQKGLNKTAPCAKKKKDQGEEED